MYFRIYLSYSGFNYRGIDSGNLEDNTILNKVKQTLNNFSINIYYIRFQSRTDAKVNAYNNNVIVCTNKNINNIEKNIKSYIRNITNNEIIINNIEYVCNINNKITTTHIQKTYIYKIINVENAITFHTHLYWIISNKDFYTIKEWLKQINNKEIDYSIFCKEYSKNKRPIIQKLQFKCVAINITNNIKEILIYCTGECFMYKQVRMIIGTLLKLLKKNQEINMLNFIHNKENKKYVYSAAAHALYLI